MKLDLPKDWKKILVWIIGIIISIIVIFLYSEHEFESNYTETNYTTSDKDRIEIDELKYVEHEDINANDSYYKKDDNSKYSQIRVKNNSTETIYQLEIELKEQEMEEPSGILIPSYYLDVLAPGESAILTSKHENIRDDENLELNEYSYCDGKGTLYRITKLIEDGKTKIGIHSETNDKLYKYNDISSEVDVLSFKKISEKEENNKIYYEMEIKNNSSINIRDIYLNFNEYHNNNIVGINTKRYEGTLKSGGTIVSRFDSKEEIKLDLVSYGYSKYDESSKDKIITNYNIYVKQGKYEKFEFEDYETSSRKRLFLSISNLVIIPILWTVDVIVKRMETKGELEEDKTYIKRGKNISKIKYILFILYIVIPIILMFLY